MVQQCAHKYCPCIESDEYNPHFHTKKYEKMSALPLKILQEITFVILLIWL